VDIARQSILRAFLCKIAAGKWVALSDLFDLYGIGRIELPMKRQTPAHRWNSMELAKDIEENYII